MRNLLVFLLLLSANLSASIVTGNLRTLNQSLKISTAGFTSAGLEIPTNTTAGFVITMESSSDDINYNLTMMCKVNSTVLGFQCSNTIFGTQFGYYSVYIPGGTNWLRVRVTTAGTGLLPVTLSTSSGANPGLSINTNISNLGVVATVTGNVVGASLDVSSIAPSKHAIQVDVSLPGTATITSCTLNVWWGLLSASAGSMSGDIDCSSATVRSFGFHIVDRPTNFVKMVITNWAVSAGTGVPSINITYLGTQ